MIIDFRNMNGGGGGGYVLPVATDTRLGGVKVGDFLSINSAGTLSVETTKRIGYVEYDGQVKVDDFITTMYSTFAFIKENDTNSDIELFTIVSYGNRTKAYLKSDNKYYVKQYDDTEIEITGNTPVNIYNATYTFDLSGNNLTVTADINGKDVVDLYSGTVSMFPIATTGSTGVVKVGSGLTITSDGTLNSQQDYEIVSGITDFTVGKMYAVVTTGGTYEFVGNPSAAIKCGNIKTHFYGEVTDTSAKYEFNPWISAPVNGSNQIVDVYVTKEVGDTYPTLKVNYGNENILTETLTHNLEDTGKDTYDLPSHIFNTFVFQYTNISVIFNGDNSVSVDFEGIVGTTLGGMDIGTNVFNWNTNIDNCSGSTISDEAHFNGISYTDGESAYPLTFIEGSSSVSITDGSDDMHKRLRTYQMSQSPNLNLSGYNNDMRLYDGKLWTLKNYNGAVNCSVYNEQIGYSSDTEHVIQWYGSLPQDQILFVLTAHTWSAELWYIDFDSNSDQFRLYKNPEEEIINLPKNGAVDELYNTIGWSAKDGLITIYGNEINWEIGVYGNWNQVSGLHWEPLDWLPNINNPRKFIVDYSILPYAKSDRKGALTKVNGVPDGGNYGQVIMKNNNGYGWESLVIPTEVQVSDTLPTFGSDGSIAIVNTGASATGSTAFLSMDNTSSDAKNNFSDTNELPWYDGGNHYVYFDNGDLATTAKTFLYRIAMRVNEDWDWNSTPAYINVYREYDGVSQTYFFSWDMPPFEYYDTNGDPYTYSDSGVVNSNTTSANTIYLPLFRWWDGSEGYKFCFEYDNGNLKLWSRHSDVDENNQEPDYHQGEHYYGQGVRCQNHTTEFYNGMGVSGTTSIYTFKGGVWYQLGDLA